MFLNRQCLISTIVKRQYSTSSEQYFVNRNPRNLEKLRIARKPDGYHLEKPGRRFWHQLTLTTSNRVVTAQVEHFINGPVLSASTSEWAIRKQLFSPKDTSAFINLGKIFGQRCLESGLTEMECNIEFTKGGKIHKFLNEVKNCGIRLNELEQYKKPRPSDLKRPEKPWEVTE